MDVSSSLSSPLPYAPTLTHLVLALGLGIFVGLERENRGKEAGVRTFAFATILGCLGALLGQTYAIVSLILLAVLVVFLNLQRLQTNATAELTTSVALLVMGFAGVLCGFGHTFTPVAVAVISAALLAWKQPLSGFSMGLTEEEIRSAILLAILTFIILPVLPAGAVDPWSLIEPRTAWTTVILVAGIGFVNYVLWKVYGTRGITLTGFLGGLVNSTVVVTELAGRVKTMGANLVDAAYQGIVLATAAMLLRNTILIGILSHQVLLVAAPPLLLMFLACGGIVWRRLKIDNEADEATNPVLHLASPFSLPSALKFGALFIGLDIAGALAQRFLGSFGFYAVSFVGGLASSASAVASASTLAAHGRISPIVAAHGAVIASLASILVNLPLILRITRERDLTLRLSLALGGVMALGLIALLTANLWLPALQNIARE